METEGKQKGNHRHFLGLVTRVKAVLQRDLAQTDKVCVPMLLSVAELGAMQCCSWSIHD